MAEQLQQVKTVSDDGVASQTTRTVTEDRAKEPQSRLAARVIWFIAGVINTLLVLRFVFVLLGANAGNGFVNFIYSVSHPFAAPFFGIFGYSTHYGVSRFESSTIVAILVYTLVAWGLTRLVTIRQPERA
jgi:hypothetical protein